MTVAYVGVGLSFSYNRVRPACTPWSQNSCTSPMQFTSSHVKIKGQKSPAISVPFYQEHKNFPWNLPSLAPPHSLPLSGLLLLKSCCSELGYSATSTCKGDWERYLNQPRPIMIHCPGLGMLLSIRKKIRVLSVRKKGVMENRQAESKWGITLVSISNPNIHSKVEEQF